ncbi:uncharacterized protein LOC124716794 [Schistocerca piceifrons]|uniref:uncharacterized protein LOC124716794 n=2 Tax=Schistocerca TaxID=7008 RepID=UPI001F5F0C53|nr:uncharacterized protein LOC124716794 [Schistocerca piceifrons]
MRRWMLVALALFAACAHAPASAESDPELLAKGAEALRLIRRRAERFPDRPEARIYKGTLADRGMFPYAAFAAVFGRACSSTIVDRRFVLLTRMCTDARPDDGIVMAGGTEFTTIQDLTPPEVQIRQIQRWWVHPYRHVLWHDITIARLFAPWVFGEFVGTLPIPDQHTWGSGKLTCTMTGFGEAVVGDRQHLLHYVALEMRDYGPCQELASAMGIPIGDNSFCTTKTKKASMCEGDSGGPVMCRGQLYGINSDKIPKGPKLIRECGEKVLCNYFMYLGYYKGWINRIIYNNTLTDTDSTPLSTRHPIIHGTEGRIRAAAAATAACPLLAACPRQEPKPRVFFGTPAKLKQFPNAALAVVLFRACTATIVHTRFVLLSSWCTAGRFQDGVVMAGNVQFHDFRDIIYPVVQVRLIQRWWMYPWDHAQWNDITVAQVYVPFVFNSYVEMEPLTDWSTFGNTSKLCQIAGFGEQFSWDVRHTLHYATLDMTDSLDCKVDAGAFNAPVGENVFCTKDTEENTMCDGDAGGPVMCYGFLNGIISDMVPVRDDFMRNCSSPAKSNYFMFIGYYRKWIMGTIVNNTPTQEEESNEIPHGHRRPQAASAVPAPTPTPPVGGLSLCLCSLLYSTVLNK